MMNNAFKYADFYYKLFIKRSILIVVKILFFKFYFILFYFIPFLFLIINVFNVLIWSFFSN